VEYTKFLELIQGKEKYNVDFKIQNDTFLAKTLLPRAELAKDICAMANNGNIASYILVGVSDDGNAFKSVSNPKLTDDSLQDFCKKNIFPPPKVKLTRKLWAKAEPQHKDKEFVIIQIGPQKRQAFRLTQDFIDYKEGVCYRRNEVWIRRGATSDLAIPEEIARLIEGKSPIENEDVLERKKEREEFLTLPVDSRTSSLFSHSIKLLEKELMYEEIHPKRGFGLNYAPYIYSMWDCFKTLETFVMVVRLYDGIDNLTVRILKLWFEGSDNILQALPNHLNKMPVRVLWIIPVLSRVPRNRIQSVKKGMKWSGTYSHFYRPSYHGSSENRPTSFELLVIDDIKSASDYEEKFITAMKDIEQYTDTFPIYVA
jgi:hypothetical protein